MEKSFIIDKPKNFDIEEDFFIVPNVIGMSLSQAIIALDKQNINYEIARL